jgi:signal transduction histidine kinase/ActR/RegA family two-component response regulator
VCKFSHPLFYKSMFDRTSSLLAILEYNYAYRDCILMRANMATEAFFALDHETERSPRTGQLGVCFDEDDIEYLSNGNLSEYPRINPRLAVVRPNPGSTSFLSATFTFIGRSLRGRRLFGFVADDVTKLVSAQANAEDSRRQMDAQSAFFAKMVHELRSPLSGMLGMTALLKQDTVMTSEQSGMVHTIETCSNSLLSLVSDVLDMSRLERNMVTLTKAPFNVSRCIEEAFAIVSPQAERKVDLLYEIDFGGRSPFIVGDVMRVRQILINLVSNAIKFTDKPNRVILVKATRTAIDDAITFHVHDAGIGIAEHAQAQVFNSFSQATPAVSERFGGTGLGLAIVKSLVELMQGTIGVSSQEGVGSVFYLSIPATGASGGADPVTAAPEQDRLASAIRVLSGKTTTVSLANEPSTANLANRLATLGMRVLSRESSPEQVDVAFGESVDTSASSSASSEHFVVVDWTRPVRWTGHFLRKPIQTQALLECLSRVLHVKPRPADAGPMSRPATILVVDDSVVSRKVVVRMLEKLGYPASLILTASDGIEALALLERQPKDVILLDVMMPVMNGIDTAREICRRWPSTRPYMIGLTADVTDSCKNACCEAGMDMFLSKPVQSDSLTRAMAEAMSWLNARGVPVECSS